MNFIFGHQFTHGLGTASTEPISMRWFMKRQPSMRQAGLIRPNWKMLYKRLGILHLSNCLYCAKGALTLTKPSFKPSFKPLKVTSKILKLRLIWRTFIISFKLTSNQPSNLLQTKSAHKVGFEGRFDQFECNLSLTVYFTSLLVSHLSGLII